MADPNAALRDGAPPEIIDAEDQAQAILKKIREWQQGNVSISDIAILYRANWQKHVNALVRELALCSDELATSAFRLADAGRIGRHDLHHAFFEGASVEGGHYCWC